MVESLRDSIRYCGSHGTAVPSPKERLQAHCRIHPSVYPNALVTSAMPKASRPARASRVACSQPSSPYVRYHWSVRATTHSPPLRLITSFSGSL